MCWMVSGISRLENYKTEVIVVLLKCGHIKYRSKRTAKVMRKTGCIREPDYYLTIVKWVM